jgi:hypothetical protein
MYDMFGGSSEDPARRAQATRRAESVMGAGRFAADFTPIVSDAIAIDEVRDAYRQGNYGTAAILGGATMLGMLPVAGDAASRAVRLRQVGSGPIPRVTRDSAILARVGDADSVNSMEVEFSNPTLSQVPIARAEDLIDRGYYTGITDTSRSGLDVVNSVNKVPINSVMRGGTFWGFQDEQVGKGHAFSSAETAVAGQLNRAELALEKSPRKDGAVFVPHGMIPGSSSDFATQSADIAVPYAQQVLSRADKEALDLRIRSGKGKKYEPIPNWPGIDNANPQYLQSIGGRRKDVLYALDEFRDAGALSLSQVRAIVTDPQQMDAPWGAVNSFYLMNPDFYAKGNKAFGESSHPAYAAAKFGRPLGASSEGFDILNLNPSIGTRQAGEVNFYDEMSSRADIAKQNLNAAILSGDTRRIGAARSALQGYDFGNFGAGGGAGSSIQATLKAGGQGVFTRDIIDEMVRQALIVP